MQRHTRKNTSVSFNGCFRVVPCFFLHDKQHREKEKERGKGKWQRELQVIYPTDMIYDMDMRWVDKCAPKLDRRRNGL